MIKSNKMVKFPLVGFFAPDVVDKEYKNWNQLFKGLGIKSKDDYYVDTYTVDISKNGEWNEYYINIIITNDSYKIYAYKQFYEEYINSEFRNANISLLLDTLREDSVELFMRCEKNFPIKKFMRLDYSLNGVGINKKNMIDYYYYEAVVL